MWIQSHWTTLIVIAIVFSVICGVVAAVISVGEWFAKGAAFGIWGIAAVVSQKPGLLKVPSGMRSVKCPRCNAVQNIGETQADYACSQCKTVNAVQDSE